MKIVTVKYTTRDAYAADNRRNILAVVNELKAIGHPGIRYSAYVFSDGKTFMHFDHFENEAAHQFLQELASFKKFASELWNSKLEAEPKLDLLTVAGSTEPFLS